MALSASSSPTPLLLIIFPVIFLQLFHGPVRGQDIFPHAVCSKTGNFTTNGSYQTTLTSLLSSTDNINFGFFNASSPVSQTSETITVLGLCRGDVPADACRNCLRTSATDIQQLCPNQKEAIVWNENCTVRYSNQSILGSASTDPSYDLYSTASTKSDQFSTEVRELLGNLSATAAAGGPLRKFTTGNSSVEYDTVYGLVQCTPDLTEDQCNYCLLTVIGKITNCCVGRPGVRILAPSCFFRYETNDRFFDPVAEALPVPTSPSGKKSNSKTVIIVSVVAAISAVIILLGILLFLRLRRRRRPTITLEKEPVDEISTAESLQFDFDTVREATDDFSDAKRLGQGGFGAVYMGRLPNGQEIAVKRLSRNSGQGELEFKNEVTLLAQLQHRNLVRLLGFCLEGVERLLIYEFVPNSSLDHFIFDPVKRAVLNWERRNKIIMGIARGLLYLHEDSRLRIIHRDLKASNILLDEDMNPKISDFGMAKLFAQDQTRADTSRIVGTYGYMAPEYAMHGNFSVKSDVFSFGVLILEIVSGQRNSSFGNTDRVEDLISSAWRNWREGTISNIIDPTLSSGSRSEMARCIHIGLLCVQENVADRPTMASVVLMLNSHSLTLQVPSRPGFFVHYGMESDISSSRGYDSRASHDPKTTDNVPSHQFSENEVSLLYPR